jgi:hypothetical protein
MRFSIRRAGEGGDFREEQGDLSLGGVAFTGTGEAAPGTRYDVRFRLPNSDRELQVQAEALAPVKDKLHLRFVDVDTATELAIARYLDGLAGRSR